MNFQIDFKVIFSLSLIMFLASGQIIESVDPTRAFNSPHGYLSSKTNKAHGRAQEGSGPRDIIRRGPMTVIPPEVIEQETSSIIRLTSSFRFIPKRDFRGQFVGYELGALIRGGFAELIGFKNGDVILAVGKQSLRSTSDIYKVYRKVKKSSEPNLRILFLRAGKEMTLLLMRQEDLSHD